MKYLKMLGLAAIAATALTAFTAGSASATTLEVGGEAKNSSVTISASIAAGNSAILARTDGTLANTCTASTVAGATASPFTGTKVTGAISTLSWSGCSAGNPTVHQKGQLYVEHEAPTTNGKVFSENAEVTVPTSLGFTVNCKTGAGTEVGTLTGTGDVTKHAIMHVNAVLNCGFLLPSATWKGTYTVTSPTGLGVSA